MRTLYEPVYQMEELLKNKLTELYKDYFWYIRQRAFQFFGDIETANDIVHDVFYKVITEVENGNSKVLNKNYCLRMATNLCIDKYRRKQIIKIDQSENIADYSGGSWDPETLITVKSILKKIPSSLREIAIYKFVDGLTLDEISLITNTPKRTVQRKIEKIKKKFGHIFNSGSL